ncbi:MAG TPA: Os1348 family NHLP clan protein [Ktedonobacteraceae bacterium]|nr:Os1348 family NHLP clan protein [Ktedonobacteraceae bacterium]
MSWQTLNNILTRAMIDPLFANKLLSNPLEAVHEFGFEITPREQQILNTAQAKDISELSQLLLTQLGDTEE